MTTVEILGLALVLLTMGLGLIGCIVPGIPGAGLVFIAALVHRLIFGVNGAATWVLVVLGLFTALALLLDYVSSVYGAKRLGATWRGLIGALVGGLIGMFFSLPGILLGPFIGAFLFEWLGGRKPREAGKAGLGAILGLLGGTVAKFACCVVMIVLFATNVVYRSMTITAPPAAQVIAGRSSPQFAGENSSAPSNPPTAQMAEPAKTP